MSSKKSVEKSTEKPGKPDKPAEKPAEAIDYDRLADAIASRLGPLLFIAARVGELNTRQTLERFETLVIRAINEGLHAYSIVAREDLCRSV